MPKETDIRPFRVDMPDEAIADLRRRIAAIVAECNDAQTRVTSLRNTPERF